MDAAEACFRSDVIHHDPAQGEMRGAASWRAYGETFKAAAPDARLELKIATEAGDRIAVEGTFSGTFTGPLQTPQGEAPPTGNAFAIDYVDVFEAKGGQFSAQRVYYDQIAMLTQLGLMPEGAAAG
jgi:ketosteroid isomerase-like protein